MCVLALVRYIIGRHLRAEVSEYDKQGILDYKVAGRQGEAHGQSSTGNCGQNFKLNEEMLSVLMLTNKSSTRTCTRAHMTSTY